jgi:Coenzyme PQQ synthesis protein D (PqqD)
MTTLRLRSDALKWREIEDEVVAVDMRNSTYLSANESAVLLWRELSQGTTRERLVELLVETYGLGAEQAGGDVDRFLADLEAQGLLAE